MGVSAPGAAEAAGKGIDGPARDRLAAYLGTVAGGRVEITAVARLAGGAIQENWGIDLVVDGGPMAGPQALVLRCSAAAEIEDSHPRGHEFALLKAVFAAGVTVPEPLWFRADADVIGRPFMVMRRVSGIAIGQKIVRDSRYDGLRDALAERLGRELALIHDLRPGHPGLDFLGPPPDDPARAAIDAYRAYLDRHPRPRPALEWGLRWVERDAPTPPPEIVLCHRDFRTGNYLVDENAPGAGGLGAILDWEFAGWGDPIEDLAWFCAKCWRFGANRREAGGIARRARFVAAYEAVSGRAVEAARFRFWEVMAHVRWAVIALKQAERHLSGREPSLELAAIGRRVPEMEYEILRLTGASR